MTTTQPTPTARKIADIKIGNRFRKDLGDIDSLAQSIQKIGLLHPVVINSNNEFIAGQRRLEAAKRLGWNEIPTTVLDIEEIVKGEFDENMLRQDFTFSEMVAIKRAVEPELKQQAENRQKIGKKLPTMCRICTR